MIHGNKKTDRHYHVQDNADVAHQDLIIYCNTNQLQELNFCGPHSKPHGARGLSKHYHLRFYEKLGNGVCAKYDISLSREFQHHLKKDHYKNGVFDQGQKNE